MYSTACRGIELVRRQGEHRQADRAVNRFLEIDAAELQRFWQLLDGARDLPAARDLEAGRRADRGVAGRDRRVARTVAGGAEPARCPVRGPARPAHAAECVAAWLRREYAVPPTVGIEAVSATDLTADPLQHLSRDLPTLLVSFASVRATARKVSPVSGSPEQLLSDCRHLVLNLQSRRCIGALRAGRAGRALPDHARRYPMTVGSR